MRKLIAAFSFLFLSALMFGQTATVSGHVITGQNTASSSGISVLFELTNDGGQQCKVGGTGLVMPMTATFTQAQLAAGVSLLRNDQITCGTTLGGTRWRYTIKSGGTGTRQCSINVVGATNLDSTVCLNATATPVTTTPTDSVYARIDGTNAGFTGDITHNGHNDTGIGTVGAVTANVSGNETVGGTLGVTGAETVGGTLGVTGVTSLSSVSTSGNANVGGTLGVTGNTTLAAVTNTSETSGSTLPATINTFNNALHAPFNAFRSTTETQQPDHYMPGFFVNYQPSGGTNASGKMKPLGIHVAGIYNATGEHGGVYAETYSSGSGDNVGIEAFAYYGGMADDGGGEAAEAGRFQADGTVGTVFTATLSSATNNGSTFTLPYTGATNEVTGRGVNRWLIRTDGGTYTTGTISSFSGTGTITVTGAGTGWTAGLGTGAHSDLCFAVNSDTVSTFKFVIPVTSVTDDTHLVLTYVVNASNASWPSSNTGNYTIYKCSKVSDVSTFGTMTVTNGYSGWAAAQTIESPVGYSGHMEGVRALINPAVPWATIFPAALFHGVNLSTRSVWGLWFDSTFPLSRGLNFQNTWATNPDGSDTTVVVDVNTSPNAIIKLRDSTTSTHIFFGTNSGDIYDYSPSTRLFSWGTTGLGIKLSIDPTTGNIAYAGGGSLKPAQILASGTAAMTTAGIATGACGTTVTVGATGAATTDIINISHNAAVTIGNGGGLTLNSWPTSGNVNFNYCNSSAGTITPTAMTINWQITR